VTDIEVAGHFHGQGLMRSLLVVVVDERIEARLLLQEIRHAGLVACCFSVECMRSCRPFCSGCPGRMRSMPTPSRRHQTDSLLSP
jgi:hypothetical protein